MKGLCPKLYARSLHRLWVSCDVSKTSPIFTINSLRSNDRAQQNVSTWSPLAAAFNTKPSQKFNLSLKRDNAGLFQIPELHDFTGFYLLQQQVQNEVENLVTEATSPHRTRGIVQIFDQLSDCLCRVADMADFVRVAHPQKDFAQAAEEACVSLSGLVEKLNTNTQLYRVLKKVLEGRDVVALDEVDKRVGELFLFDFEQSGIHLDEEKRKAYVQLNESLLLLGTYFMQGTQKATAVPKNQLPETIRHCFTKDGDNISVTGLFSDHYNPLVREAAYRIFLYPDTHQGDLLDALLLARYQVARLVGFPTFAHRALKGTMAETPENVTEFLESLAEKLRPRANIDYEEILKLKQAEGIQSKSIMPWDPPYYSAVGRQKICRISGVELAPYLSLGSCMDGLNNLFQQLYGVSLEHEDVQPGEVWSFDVRKLAVVSRTEGVLGYIYCDFYERAGKHNQDCHFTIQGGRMKEDGNYQCPIVVLQLNFPPPQKSIPSLLSMGMMENLFHEFGHAMHSMLGRTKYQHVTGTRCPTDFAEVPSVLMEYFASDPRVMSTFARHYKTGEPLSSGTINSLCQAKKMFAASDMQLQVFYSLLDQAYHGKHPLGQTTTDILATLENKYYGIPFVPGTAWQLRFGHLVGYGAKYYSYLMSRAVASWIWHRCFKADPFNRLMGEQYRQEMLVHGGGRHPRELVQGMLKEDPTMEKLVDSLIEDLDGTEGL